MRRSFGFYGHGRLVGRHGRHGRLVGRWHTAIHVIISFN